MLFSSPRQTARQMLLRLISSLAYGVRRRILQTAGAVAVMLVFSSPIFAQQGPARIVALGDSLSAGYLLPQKNAFPTVLERVLRERGHKVEVSNAGVSGDTARGGLERLDWAVGDGADLVIVELGANVMLRGVDPAITKTALANTALTLNTRNTTGVYPPGLVVRRQTQADTRPSQTWAVTIAGWRMELRSERG